MKNVSGRKITIIIPSLKQGVVPFLTTIMQIAFFANRPLCFEVTPFKMKYDKSTCYVHPHKRPKNRSHAWHTTQTVNVDVAEKMPLNIDGINFSIQILKIEYSNTIISSVTVAS